MLPGQLTLPNYTTDLSELSRKRASEPLRPSKPQEPCDVGLFSDNAAQLDLVAIAQQGK